MNILKWQFHYAENEDNDNQSEEEPLANIKAFVVASNKSNMIQPSRWTTSNQTLSDSNDSRIELAPLQLYIAEWNSSISVT